MKTVFVLFCPLGSKICAHCLAKWFYPKILRDTKEWHLDITVGLFMYKVPTRNPYSVVYYRLYKYLIMKGDTNG